jgi:hypothetical protein
MQIPEFQRNGCFIQSTTDDCWLRITLTPSMFEGVQARNCSASAARTVVSEAAPTLRNWRPKP